jgi:hypothetical protein
LRTLTVVESKATRVEISNAEARLLNALGIQLASKSSYWRDRDDENLPERTVIRCSFDGGHWSLYVHNAIGIIKAEDVQILVIPKIPMSHLVFLMSLSGTLPRFVKDSVLAAASQDFLELIARWFMFALEALLRRDLVRDYFELYDDLPAARGQIMPMATAQNYYSGRLSLTCRFEEFDLETPLNRILKAGLERISVNAGFDYLLRRSASRVSRRLDVGPLRAGDLVVNTDRRTAHYRDAVMLAKLLIRNEARTVELGGDAAWSFLIATPGPVEDGIRALLAQKLSNECKVTNRALTLKPSGLTVNPDIVFEPGTCIADVKYKLADGEWRRSDLYQVVAFATAYNARRAAIVTFGRAEEDEPPQVTFGTLPVQQLTWDVSEGTTPEEAATRIVKSAMDWLPFDVPAASPAA